MHILLTRVSLVAGALSLLAGCASDGQAQPEATARVKEERCVVTGAMSPSATVATTWKSCHRVRWRR